MALELWLTLLGANLVLLLAPGPTMLLVVGTTLEADTRAALATVGGIFLGVVGSVSASMAGVGALLAVAPGSFVVIQCVGATYLCLLGVRALRRPTNEPHVVRNSLASPWRLWVRGFVTEVTNPKAMLFYAAFVPQFLNPAAPMAQQCAVVLLTLALQGLVFDGCCVALAGRVRVVLTSPHHLRLVNRLAGLCLLAAGAGTLTLVP